MIEVIADLDRRAFDASTGREYFVNVAGEEMSNGIWEAWLEFIPLDDSDPLLTDTETHKNTRAHVVQWANGLTEVYVQGAFDRAVAASAHARVPTWRIATPIVPPATGAATALDPFEALLSGEESLRARLQPLTRAELLATIEHYNLDPARLSLARLTDRQLITFIVTATQVQGKFRKE
jgi:hypothetical protein